MGRAKDIIVKVIPSKEANAFVKKTHYSGKVVPNSSLHYYKTIKTKRTTFKMDNKFCRWNSMWRWNNI